MIRKFNKVNIHPFRPGRSKYNFVNATADGWSLLFVFTPRLRSGTGAPLRGSKLHMTSIVIREIAFDQHSGRGNLHLLVRFPFIAVCFS